MGILAGVDLGVIARKWYSTFFNAPGLEPQHQIQSSVITMTLVAGGGYIPLVRDGVLPLGRGAWVGSYLGSVFYILTNRAENRILYFIFMTFFLSFFLSFMAYQLSWVIQCQSHPCRRIVEILFWQSQLGCRIHRLHLCWGVRILKYPRYDNKLFDGEAPVITGALGNVEYPFAAIAPRSTLARSDSIW